MLIEFKVFITLTPANVMGAVLRRAVDHLEICDFSELEDGKLEINLYDGTEQFITDSFTFDQLKKKINDLEFQGG